MIKFLADENFDNRIVRGLSRRFPDVDVVHVQDVVLVNTDDREILAWAAYEKRVLLTHDVATMTAFAYERITKNLPMSGIFEVPKNLPVGEAIEQLILIAECSLKDEWENQVRFLPLR
jgi:hypothetical protein